MYKDEFRDLIIKGLKEAVPAVLKEYDDEDVYIMSLEADNTAGFSDTRADHIHLLYDQYHGARQCRTSGKRSTDESGKSNNHVVLLRDKSWGNMDNSHDNSDSGSIRGAYCQAGFGKHASVHPSGFYGVHRVMCICCDVYAGSVCHERGCALQDPEYYLHCRGADHFP